MSDFVNGMIFVCDDSTADDMFKHQIFGLPLTYLREMKLLVPEKSALFLLEKQTQLIRGIFVPTCNAKRMIVPDIWLYQDQCSFPSQIRFKLHSSFAALSKESEFAPQFLRKMKVKGKFLDRSRVRSLVIALSNSQSAMKSEKQRHDRMQNIHCAPDFSEFSTAHASLSYLQQQNELMRLENHVLKVRSEAEEARQVLRDRDTVSNVQTEVAEEARQILRDHHKAMRCRRADESFGFEQFRDSLEYAEQRIDESFDPTLLEDEGLLTDADYSRRPAVTYDLEASHFSSEFEDGMRNDWDSMLPPIPHKYDNERWASPDYAPVQTYEFDIPELEHRV